MYRPRQIGFWLAVVAGLWWESAAFAQDSGNLVVRAATARVMSGSEVVGEVRSGERFAFTQRNGDWYRITVQQGGRSRQGWVHRDNIALETAARFELPKISPLEENWLKKQVMMTRSRPKLQKLNTATGQTELIGEVQEADARVDKIQGDWLWIRTPNQEGWIARADAVPMDQAIEYFTAMISQNANDAFAYNQRAIVWKNKKEFDKALADYTESIRLNPSSAVIHNRGVLWQVKREFEKAIADYDESIRLDAQNFLAFCHRGEVFHELKEYDKAIADYTEAIRILPGYAVAYSNRGWSWLAKNEHDIAFGDFSDAIRYDPKLPGPYRGRAYVHHYRKNYDNAITDYTQALTLQPGWAAVYSERGWSLFEKKEYDRAIRDFSEAVKVDPQLAYAYRGLGRSRHFLKNYDAAAADFDDFVRRMPTSALGYLDRGWLRFDQKLYERAIDDFRQALRHDPNSAYAHRGLGRSYQQLKEYGRALDEFNELVRLLPQWATGFNDRGWLYQEMKDYDKAVGDYSTAIRLDPNFTTAYINRTVAWRMKREFDRALADVAEVLRREPQSWTAFFQRANTYRGMKQYELALRDYNEAYRLEPKNAGLVATRGYTRFLSQEYDQALRDFETALSLDPKNGWAYRNRAMLYACAADEKYRDGAKALENLRQAQEILPPAADVYEAQAAVAAELGNFDEAVQWQTKVLEELPYRDNPDQQSRLAMYREKQPYREVPGQPIPIGLATVVRREPAPPLPAGTRPLAPPLPADEPPTLNVETRATAPPLPADRGSATRVAGRFTGKVTAVAGKTVFLTASGNQLPAVGDKLQITVDVPGVGPAEVATVTVTELDGQTVVATVDKATGRVQVGQAARSQADKTENTPSESFEARHSDYQRLEGTWVCESTQKDGQPSTSYVGVRAVIAGDSLTWYFPQKDGTFREQKNVFRIDPTQEPKHFDWWEASKSPESMDRRIYTVSDDELRWATNLDGKTRPTDFASARWQFRAKRVPAGAPPGRE